MAHGSTMTSTPNDLRIVRRDVRFDLEGRDVRAWHPEGRHVAHFFNALSLLFPEGESFFIDSVRHYRDRILGGADGRFAAVWRWHAIEETEHKAVAYDVYREVVGEDRPAYWRRVRVMLLITVAFWIDVFRNTYRLVRADGAAADLPGWWRLFRFLWIKPGGMWRIWRLWLGYFRRDFHPWQHDNRRHVEEWKAAYEGTAAALA